MSYQVYPGEVHSRFGQSLGVMEFASRIFDAVFSTCVTDDVNVRSQGAMQLKANRHGAFFAARAGRGMSAASCPNGPSPCPELTPFHQPSFGLTAPQARLPAAAPESHRVPP